MVYRPKWFSKQKLLVDITKLKNPCIPRVIIWVITT
jgi:hypothetical protein